MNLTIEKNIRALMFKDYYPKIEYSEAEFVQDTDSLLK